MDEEKRLKEENDALLNKIVTKVTTTTGSKPLDIIKGEVDAHKQVIGWMGWGKHNVWVLCFVYCTFYVT